MTKKSKTTILRKQFELEQEQKKIVKKGGDPKEFEKLIPEIDKELAEKQAAIELKRASKLGSVKQIPRKRKVIKKRAEKRLEKPIQKKTVQTLKQQVEISQKDIKEKVFEVLASALANVTNFSEESVEPNDKTRQLAKDIINIISNEQLFNHLARLITFLNNKDSVGQFAKLFQNKVAQGVYTAERLADLTISEMLPEVFLNPNTDEEVQAEILKQIDKKIQAEAKDLEVKISLEISYEKDPTKKRIDFRRTAFDIRVPISSEYMDKYKKDPVNETMLYHKDQKPSQVDIYGKKLYAKQGDAVPVKEICDNASWNTKAVNIIVCKEDGKFYCLDVQKIVEELGATGKATNYVTGNPLHSDVQANIQKRYSAEINAIKRGEKVVIGEWIDQDITHMQKTEAVLKEIQNNMEKGTSIKEVVADLPVLERSNVTENWVTKNIKTIQENLQGGSLTEQKLVKKVTQVPTKKQLAENQIVAEQILKKDSIAGKLFEQFLSRLHNLRDNVTRDLPQLVKDLQEKAASSGEEKQISQQILDKREKLAQIGRLIEKLESEMRTFQGVTSRLREEITLKQDLINGINSAIGMNMIIPNDLLLAQEEKKLLEKYVQDVSKELAYIDSVETIYKNKNL